MRTNLYKFKFGTIIVSDIEVSLKKTTVLEEFYFKFKRYSLNTKDSDWVCQYKKDGFTYFIWENERGACTESVRIRYELMNCIYNKK